MREKIRYPDFLGIGVQKCATSWLDKNLRAHPELWFPAIKELHYFNTLYLREKGPHWSERLRKNFALDALKWHFEKLPPEKWNLRRLGELGHIASDPVDDTWYGAIFASADPHQICGEITPDYALLPDRAIQHIIRLSPEIKVIISLRDPIDRNWSEIRMVASEKGSKSEKDFHSIARQFEVFQRTDYVGLLKRWARYLPSERIHVLFTDDIAADPRAAIGGICKFLDVRADFSLFHELNSPANVGESMDIPDGLYALLKEQLRGRYAELAQLYPATAETWAARHQL